MTPVLWLLTAGLLSMLLRCLGNAWWVSMLPLVAWGVLALTAMWSNEGSVEEAMEEAMEEARDADGE